MAVKSPTQEIIAFQSKSNGNDRELIKSNSTPNRKGTETPTGGTKNKAKHHPMLLTGLLNRSLINHLSHVTRKRTFREFRPGNIQINLISCGS